MKLIKLEGTRVIFIHHHPEELTAEERKDGILVEEIPSPPAKVGFNAILHYENGDFWYEQVELSPEPPPEPTEFELLANYLLDLDMRLIILELSL